MAKHKKKNSVKKKYEEKTNNTIGLKLLVFGLCAGLYFTAIWFLNRLIYNDCLFFVPRAAVVMAAINAIVILFSAFLFSKNTIKYIKTHKRNSSIIAVITCLLLVLPVFMFKSGTVADSKSIRKYNIFGRVVQQYSYSDITSFETSVHRSVIQYDIEFESGDSIFICAYDAVPFYNFYNDNNLKQFDQILASNGKRIVPDPRWTLPDYTKRFIKDEEVFEYFYTIFSEY